MRGLGLHDLGLNGLRGTPLGVVWIAGVHDFCVVVPAKPEIRAVLVIPAEAGISAAFVIPAKAGIHAGVVIPAKTREASMDSRFLPASAGMTGNDGACA